MKRFKQWRKDHERGAALVEFALVLPLLVVLFSGVVDFGQAWSNSNGLQSALRQASVVGFDKGNDFDHDYHIMRSVANELEFRGIRIPDNFIIFDADQIGPDDDLPAACYTSGVNDLCNRYTGGVVRWARNKDSFFPHWTEDCSTTYWRARRWCPTERGSSGDPYKVGVEIIVTQDSLVGILPFFDEYTLTKRTVILEIPRS